VSETGRISDGSAGRQTDYIILFYIKLFGRMYRQAENFYFIFIYDTTAVRIENNTNNLESIVHSTSFDSV